VDGRDEVRDRPAKEAGTVRVAGNQIILDGKIVSGEPAGKPVR